MQKNRTSLGEYLRARRNACRPEDVGLADVDGRRVPGLRRDEVADRARVSAEYYRRLEQDRVASPSIQVLDALADALLLDGVERAYLHRLTLRDADLRGRAVPPSRIALLMEQWEDLPSYLVDRNRDIVASNRLNRLLTAARHVPGVNMLEELFDPALRDVFGSEWSRRARTAVASFRFDVDLASPRAQEVIDRLWREPVFRQTWLRHDVAASENHDVTVRPPGDEPFVLRVNYLRVPTLPGHQLTVYTAPAGSGGAEALRRLSSHASVAA